MLTLAFAQIVYAVVHQWDEVTGGDNGLLSVWPPPWLAAPVRYYYCALVAGRRRTGRAPPRDGARPSGSSSGPRAITLAGAPRRWA